MDSHACILRQYDVNFSAVPLPVTTKEIVHKNKQLYIQLSVSIDLIKTFFKGCGEQE